MGLINVIKPYAAVLSIKFGNIDIFFIKTIARKNFGNEGRTQGLLGTKQERYAMCYAAPWPQIFMP